MGHTGTLCVVLALYECQICDKSFERSKQERVAPHPRPLLAYILVPGVVVDLTVVAQLVVPTTGSLFKATDVDAISYRRADASRAIRSSCPRLA